jgi:CheY-like chemotaxis protein/anti-sigma regulatory factor (Ser/Thr protein kinase)
VRLRQVVINLLSNAIKYNRSGGWVRVSAGAQDGWVCIDVRDSGIGMSSEQLAQLYQPFNRLGRETGSVQGTGIGLALTRQLVQLMGGQIEIRSEPGRGTSASVRLPCAAAAVARSGALAVTGATTAPAPDIEGAKGTVLYIEDNPVNVLLVAQSIARLPGVRFIHEADGRRGLARARAERPDLVLLDMQLPDISGLEVLAALRGDEPTRDLRVVALSASAMPDEVARATRAGAIHYWTKPLQLDRFLEGMHALLPASPADLRARIALLDDD